MRETYLRAAAVAADFLGTPAVAAAWGKPSALELMSVGGLAAHLSRQITMVPELVEGPVDPDAPIVSLIGHYTRVGWRGQPLDNETNQQIRGSSEDLAAPGPAAIAIDANLAVTAIPDVLDADDRGIVYVPWTGWSLRTADFLATRTLEIVVHTDDLAASVGVATPEFPADAVDAVVTLLARLSVERHGAVAVLRGLARAERAPASITAI